VCDHSHRIPIFSQRRDRHRHSIDACAALSTRVLESMSHPNAALSLRHSPYAWWAPGLFDAVTRLALAWQSKRQSSTHRAEAIEPLVRCRKCASPSPSRCHDPSAPLRLSLRTRRRHRSRLRHRGSDACVIGVRSADEPPLAHGVIQAFADILCETPPAATALTTIPTWAAPGRGTHHRAGFTRRLLFTPGIGSNKPRRRWPGREP